MPAANPRHRAGGARPTGERRRGGRQHQGDGRGVEPPRQVRQPAVPQYVVQAAQGFEDCPPGHRFNLYFRYWDESFAPFKNKKPDPSLDREEKKRVQAEIDVERAKIMNEVLPITECGKRVLDGILARNKALARTLGGNALERLVISTSPFATGLGLEHPVENGFAFLSPYGLPYLAGSGVKGVLRRAAEELALFEQGSDFTLLDTWWLFGFEGAAGAWWSLTRQEEEKLSEEQKARRAEWKVIFDAHLDKLRGRMDLLDFIKCVYPQPKDHASFFADPGEFLRKLDSRRQEIHTRGAITCWDVFPEPKNGSLVVEIMTPHYSDYYQKGATPHDAGQPNPIPFLVVPAGARFNFVVTCEPGRLPEALRSRWKDVLGRVFAHAFDWLGFGAKTAVGYGQMAEDPEAKASREREEQRRREAKAKARAEAERLAQLAQLSPLKRKIQEILDASHGQKPHRALIKALQSGEFGDEARAAAEHVRDMMKESKVWREKSEKKKPEKDENYQDTLKVLAYLEGKKP